MKLITSIYAGALMLSSVKIFRPEKDFFNKRVAIVGAADSAFQEKNGKYIDQHDIVVRINKAPHSWSPEKEVYIGKKFTYLYHSFFENSFSGGGPVDWEYFDQLGIQKVINPIFTPEGFKTQFAYYKRHKNRRTTYILSRKDYRNFSVMLKSYVPTTGFSALMSVLGSDFKELFITGFTFFQTPYANGYRDHFLKKEKNYQHINEQGLHDPNLEFELFKKKIKRMKAKNIKVDKKLQALLQSVDE